MAAPMLERGSILPDIFRTLEGLDLQLGPMDRLKDKRLSLETRDSPKLPRIILRDRLGRQLNTHSSLQEAIYRAKWNVQQSGQALTPMEWRLPKAPVPSRPDYSRDLPPIRPGQRFLDRPIVRNTVPDSVVELDVDDVGFVAESLQHVPQMPSLSFLRHDILIGPKTYFQIVGSVLLKKRFMSETDKRQPVYNFPGLCSGCMRMELCYGCERGLQPHYHEDKPVRTGGGFTYFKRDRPENELKYRNPAYWKVHYPDIALKRLMEQYGTSALGGEIPDKRAQQLGGRVGDGSGDEGQGLEYITDATGHDELVIKADLGFDKESKPDTEEDEGILADTTSEQRSAGQGPDLGAEGEGQEVTGAIESDHRPESSSGSEGMEGQDKGLEEGMLHSQGMSVPGIVAAPWMESQEASDNDNESELSGGDGEEGDDTLRTKRGDGNEDGRRGDFDREGTYETGESGEEGQGVEGGGSGDSKNRRRLYKPPSPFKPKLGHHRRIKSRSPFSTDRQYDLNLGNGMQIKKSDKKLTQFAEFQRKDSNWKEPKKFEIKKNDRAGIKFWSGPPAKKKPPGRAKARPRVPSPTPVSPDSGLASELLTDLSTKDSEVKEPPPDMENRVSTPSSVRLPTPELPNRDSPLLRQRKEIKKKEKKAPPPPKPKPLPVTLPEPEPVQEKPPEPPEEELSPIILSREPSVPSPPVPDLPSVEIPPLPEFIDEKPERRERKVSKSVIEATPELKEPPKKLKAPPKVYKIPRSKPSRRTKVAEAPVTSMELQQMKDPLDFLAKYCIISPDRLPYYDRVYNTALAIQEPRYVPPPEPQEPPPTLGKKGKGKIANLPPTQLSKHEVKMLEDLTVISHCQSPGREGLSVPEQYLEKVSYTLEFLHKKQHGLEEQLTELKAARIKYIADSARKIRPDIARHDYKIKGKKVKKKKKKKKTPSPVNIDDEPAQTFGTFGKPLKKKFEITDQVIFDRIDQKMLKKIKKDPSVKTYKLQIDRGVEKMKAIQQRLNQLEEEKDLIYVYCMDQYYQNQDRHERPEFRRQQSTLFQKLHPEPDYEMDIDEVESALQQINNHLLTDKEFQYIYLVLNLPGRRRINFRLFSIIAALSEKVAQMDPVIRKLINKFDYNALEVKMNKSKELFSLLQDGETPYGNALASNLAVELTAGGLTPEHTNYVLNKFNRMGTGYIDFLDFVTYVPLFIEIHQRIISDPLNECLDL